MRALELRTQETVYSFRDSQDLLQSLGPNLRDYAEERSRIERERNTSSSHENENLYDHVHIGSVGAFYYFLIYAQLLSNTKR